MAIKRLHYYDQQFLVEDDFTSEQRYHLDMRRRLSRVLHTFGIAEGLDVQRTGNRQVTVKAGTAVDGNGREMVLDEDQIVDLSDLTVFPASTTVHVTIAYQEAPTDPSTATGVTGNTRVTEAPLVQASTTAPPTDGSVVRLARFDKTAGGDVPGNLNDLIDGGVRQSASAKIAPGAITDANLAAGAITGAKLAAGTVTDANMAAGTITGATLAAGTVTDVNLADGAVTDAKIGAGAVSEDKLAAALAAKINTPAVTGLVSVNGVSNPGGNVDLVPTDAIQLTPNNAASQIVIGETHSARVDNPHGTTAAQIGALLASQYELGHRSTASVSYHTDDANGAVRTFNLGFQPNMILGFGNVAAFVGTRGYGGGTFGFFDSLSHFQLNTGFSVFRVADGDWVIQPGVGQGIFRALFFDSRSGQQLSLQVTVANTPTGFTATLLRDADTPLVKFSFLTVDFTCWGV